MKREPSWTRFRRKRADRLLKSRDGQGRSLIEKALPGIRAISQQRNEKRLDLPLQRCLRSALREVSRRYEKDTHWSSCYSERDGDIHAYAHSDSNRDGDGDAHSYIYTKTYAHSEEHTADQAAPDSGTAPVEQPRWMPVPEGLPIALICTNAAAWRPCLKDYGLRKRRLLSTSRVSPPGGTPRRS